MENGSPFLTFRDGIFTARAEIAMDEDSGEVELLFCDRNDRRVFSLGEDSKGVFIERVNEHGNMVPWTPKAEV